MDANDNELAYLEAIHFFVEVLDSFFGNVCELDLVFNFYKVRCERGVFVGSWTPGGERKGKGLDMTPRHKDGNCFMLILSFAHSTRSTLSSTKYS